MISGSADGNINLKNIHVKGDLIINTPDAHVDVAENVVVDGNTNIQDVSNSSFVSAATHNGKIIVTDANGAAIELNGTASNTDVEINTAANVKLRGKFNNPVTVTEAGAQIEVATGTTVANLKVTKQAIGVKVTNNGNIEKVEATESVEVEGEYPEEVEGEITGEAAKDQEVKEGKRLEGVAEGVKKLGFLSKRLAAIKGDVAGAQLAVNAELLEKAYNSGLENSDKGKNHANQEKEFYQFEDLEVKENGLKIGLSVDGEDLILGETTMSTELYNAIKASEGADENKPYSITVTNYGADNPKTKIAKIEFSKVGEEIVAKLVK